MNYRELAREVGRIIVHLGMAIEYPRMCTQDLEDAHARLSKLIERCDSQGCGNGSEVRVE